jgi:SAM-dependent methyltransferase
MTQNIYDDAAFFAAYSRLPRSERGLDGAPEWASLRAMLPEIAGLRVLDLGCGFGWFCRWAQEQCALSVTGLDVSEKMLARARELSDPSIRYVAADLDALHLVRHSVDLVYSSLAFHYLRNLDLLLGEIAGALVPGGRLVFSVEHPMFTAPAHPQWIRDAGGAKAWPINDYLKEGPRLTNWLAPGVIKQHRTLATYINLLCLHRFRILHLEEWGPNDKQLAATPELDDERQRPTFLLVSAERGE